MSKVRQGTTETEISYDDIILQPYIVYMYIDKKTNEVIYVGSDRNGDKNRRKIEHEAPSHKDKQVVNKVIQGDPDRYKFHVFSLHGNEDDMRDSEATQTFFLKAIGQAKYNFAVELGDDAIKALKEYFEDM